MVGQRPAWEDAPKRVTPSPFITSSGTKYGRLLVGMNYDHHYKWVGRAVSSTDCKTSAGTLEQLRFAAEAERWKPSKNSQIWKKEQDKWMDKLIRTAKPGVDMELPSGVLRYAEYRRQNPSGGPSVVERYVRNKNRKHHTERLKHMKAIVDCAAPHEAMQYADYCKRQPYTRTGVLKPKPNKSKRQSRTLAEIKNQIVEPTGPCLPKRRLTRPTTAPAEPSSKATGEARLHEARLHEARLHTAASGEDQRYAMYHTAGESTAGDRESVHAGRRFSSEGSVKGGEARPISQGGHRARTPAGGNEGISAAYAADQLESRQQRWGRQLESAGSAISAGVHLPISAAREALESNAWQLGSDQLGTNSEEEEGPPAWETSTLDETMRSATQWPPPLPSDSSPPAMGGGRLHDSASPPPRPDTEGHAGGGRGSPTSPMVAAHVPLRSGPTKAALEAHRQWLATASWAGAARSAAEAADAARTAAEEPSEIMG